jgi:hypothetical protein
MYNVTRGTSYILFEEANLQGRLFKLHSDKTHGIIFNSVH